MALLSAVMVGSGASAAYASLSQPKQNAPTVTFTDRGPAATVCTSEPDAAALTIRHGTWLNLINLTGAHAVDTGWAGVLTIPTGGGAAVRLRNGLHTLRLGPACLVTIGAAGTVTVDVQAGGEVPVPSPTPSPGANPSEPDGAGGGDAHANLAGGIEAAELFTSDEPDAKSSRLLALVAAICVFGVSVAIIRAILAQRTSGMVGT